MTALLLIVLLVVTGAALGLWAWRRAPHLRRRILLNLVQPHDLAVRGVLWAQRGAWLVLRDAEIVRAAAPAVRLDGEVIVERGNVAFTQVMP